MKPSHFYPVILAGGSGTRFWPLSRERFPKHLLPLIGEETLLQQTVRRASKVGPIDHVRIVTTAVQAEAVRLQLWEWKDEVADHVLLEPEGRNTAPAVGLAALRLLRRDPEATMLVLPADHVIKGEAQFKRGRGVGFIDWPNKATWSRSGCIPPEPKPDTAIFDRIHDAAWERQGNSADIRSRDSWKNPIKKRFGATYNPANICGTAACSCGVPTS